MWPYLTTRQRPKKDNTTKEGFLEVVRRKPVITSTTSQSGLIARFAVGSNLKLYLLYLNS